VGFKKVHFGGCSFVNMCAVQTRQCRTFWYDETLSLEFIIQDVQNKGFDVSLTRTLGEYGIRYLSTKQLYIEYGSILNISAEHRPIESVTLKELMKFKEGLLGFPVKGYEKK
jgi:hypothetical protein